MKNRLSIICAWAALAAVAGTTIAAGAQDKQECSQVCASASTVATLSDAEFFGVLFFGTGPASELLPEVWKGKAQDGTELAKQAAEVVGAVAKQDPGLFERVRKQATSGDRQALRDVVLEAVDQVGHVLTQSEKAGGRVFIILFDSPAAVLDQLEKDKLFLDQFVDNVANTLGQQL